MVLTKTAELFALGFISLSVVCRCLHFTCERERERERERRVTNVVLPAII